MHPLNVSSLVFGLVALGISGIWLAEQTGWVGDNDLLFPLLLIGAGLVGLVAFATRDRGGRRAERARRAESEQPTTPAEYDDTTEETLR